MAQTVEEADLDRVLAALTKSANAPILPADANDQLTELLSIWQDALDQRAQLRHLLHNRLTDEDKPAGDVLRSAARQLLEIESTISALKKPRAVETAVTHNEAAVITFLHFGIVELLGVIERDARALINMRKRIHLRMQLTTPRLAWVYRIVSSDDGNFASVARVDPAMAPSDTAFAPDEKRYRELGRKTMAGLHSVPLVDLDPHECFVEDVVTLLVARAKLGVASDDGRHALVEPKVFAARFDAIVRVFEPGDATSVSGLASKSVVDAAAVALDELGFCSPGTVYNYRKRVRTSGMPLTILW